MPEETKKIPQLDLYEVKDLISASLLWEREFDDELEFTERMKQADLPPLPEDMPDEARATVKDWFEKMKTRAKARAFKLSDVIPKRQEDATMVRAKLIQIKRILMDLESDKLSG